MNASINTQRKHLSALDGIRSFACLEIFCCHCLWGGGALGVSLFLILSGFLLTYRYLSQDGTETLPSTTPLGLIRFAWKRLRKLYLLHIIMMVIVIIIQLVRGHIQNYADWTSLSIRVLSHVFLVQTWIPVDSIYFSLNGLSWYLSTIHFCYLCFPLLLRMLKKLNTVKTAFFSLIAVFVLQVSVALISIKVFQINGTGYYYLTYVCPLFRIFDFACGGLLAVVFSKLPTARKSMLQYTVWEVLAVFAVGITQFLTLHTEVFSWDRLSWIFSWGRLSWIFLPASCFAILVFAIGGGYISKIFTAKIVKFFANLTPFIFLIHHQIIVAVKDFLGIFDLSDQKYLVAIISLVATVLLAHLYLSFRVLFLKRKRPGNNRCDS